MSWLDGITDSVGMILSTLLEIVKSREAWHATVHAVAVRHDLVTEQQCIQQTFIHTYICMCLCIYSHIHMYHLQCTEIFLFT